ncbi:MULTISPECIES: ATP-binding protein [Streptomyces]|uniref:ATP-binding protein n=1 Tax=Streptomyces badius TaxID=1941 RepID=A0ABQ2TPD0_STRBA|nr:MULTISPECIES: ATP-binding protein [Streptomyces]GGS80980.1 ATP-binding protein [Streptomyces badius]
MSLVKAHAGADRRWLEEVVTATVRNSAAYEMTSGDIGRARSFVRDFLSTGQSQHSWTVSARAFDIAQLVVSELATNVCKYAPGPCLLDVESDGTVLSMTMWDSGAVLPSPSPADPTRVGQHGLELVLAVCQSFELRREAVGKRVSVQITLQDSTDQPHSEKTAR